MDGVDVGGNQATHADGNPNKNAVILGLEESFGLDLA